MNRRTFLKRTAQAGLLAAAGSKLVPRKTFASPPGMQELQIPKIISGGDLTLAPGTAQIYPGIDTNLLLINNSFPAPTIKLKTGDTFSATINNKLGEPSVLHWHGIHAPANMSGHPKDAVPSGSSYNVNFPIIQRACTSFYHAHPDMNTGKEVYMGVSGCFIIEDDTVPNLPSGDYDIPLMITDKRFDANQQLIYTPMNQSDSNSGWLGDTVLVNGTPNAFLPVAPTLYRFRLINASNSRFYKIGLSDGKSFTVIGNDGGFLESPVTLTNAWLAPAERLDILVDLSSYSQGQNVTLQSIAFTFFSNGDRIGSGLLPQGAEMDLVQLQITKTGSSGGIVPSQLPGIVKYNVNDVKRTRLWTFAAIHHINDQPYDIARTDAHVPFGDLEQWTFSNEADNTHPVHVHGVQFQVLHRNGGAPDPVESGWKDTVRLDPLGHPSGTVDVLVKFDDHAGATDYTGLFLIHCHKLEHADMGMMANFEVDPAGYVNESLEDPSMIRINPNPASSYTMLSFPSLVKDEKLLIADEKGAEVMNIMLSAGSDRYAIITSELASGNYKIFLGNEKASLVVEK